MARPLIQHTSRALRTALPSGRRLASTFPARRRGRGVGTLLRWGLAGAAVYYYNTASVFAEEPSYATPDTHRDAETYTTVETIAAQRRAQARASSLQAESPPPDSPQADSPQADSPQALEEEAEQQGAFNEETGEINWDCPCLGGMADGPCGEQFKAAFSCFVFSKEEPKGIDCIEHFKTMQNCFREHPDVYGSELEPDDEEIVEEPDTGVAHAVNVARDHVDGKVEKVADNIASDVSIAAHEATSLTAKDTRSPQQPSKPNAGDEGGDLVPKAWHDSK